MSDEPALVVGEVIGFRAWYVAKPWQLEPPTLHSINAGRGWDDAEYPAWPHRDWMVAECPSGGARRAP